MPRISYLTTRAHNSFAHAHELAEQLGHDALTPVHLAIAIVRQKGIPCAVLHSLGVPLDVLEYELQQQLPPEGPPRPPATALEWTARDQRLVHGARAEARDLGTEFYGTEHLLLALLKDDAALAAQVFATHGVRVADLRLTQTAVCTWNPECGQVSMPAAPCAWRP